MTSGHFKVPTAINQLMSFQEGPLQNFFSKVSKQDELDYSKPYQVFVYLMLSLENF